jgi:hypothetical protein
LSRVFATPRVVAPPPRRTAYVNLWPRPRPPVDPAATIHLQQDASGMTRIHWQRLATAPDGARWDAAARTAATRCATSGS